MAYNLRPRPGVQVETLGPIDHEGSKEASEKAKKKGWSDLKIFASVLVFRWLNVALVQTSFVPDEYWQSLEVAHKMVFGYGHLTWEWQSGLRGYTYPALFAALFKVLALLNLDYPLALILAPRILQATISAVGDFCLYKASSLLHGSSVGKWTLILNLASWYVFYSATRTLTNTMEASLTSVGLYLFPWPKDWVHDKKKYKVRNSLPYIMCVAFACLVRPTAAVLWLPLCLWHVTLSRKSNTSILISSLEMIRVALVLYLPVGVGAILCSLLVDRLCYGHWVFVQTNFIDFNFIHDFGAFYGTHPWHWYFSQGIPVVMGTHIPCVIMGAKMAYRKNGILLLTVIWTMAVYSFTSHKEFRFIHPVVPICMLFCGLFMDDIHRQGKSSPLVLYLLLNIPACVFFGLLHQRGVLDVMGHVRQIASEHAAGQQRAVLFLMPCHSTPYYSFVHHELPMRFLECPPNLQETEDYVEETSRFYSDPAAWLKAEYSESTHLPTHLIMFDVLKPNLQDFLSEHNYHEVANLFHTHLPEGKMGGRILVFALQERHQEPVR